MSSTHATKGQKRYRYYTSRDASEADPAWRVSASDVEQLVAGELKRFLTSRSAIARLAAEVDATKVPPCVSTAQWRAERGDLLQQLPELGLHRIDILSDEMVLHLTPMVLLRTLGMTAEDEFEAIQLRTPVERVRRGHQVRLLIPGLDAEPSTEPDAALVKLLGEAMDARDLMLGRPEHSLQQIAAAEGRCRKRLGKLVRLSCLAPELVHGILRGQQPSSPTPRRLIEIELPLVWTQQVELFATL